MNHQLNSARPSRRRPTWGGLAAILALLAGCSSDIEGSGAPGPLTSGATPVASTLPDGTPVGADGQPLPPGAGTTGVNPVALPTDPNNPGATPTDPNSPVATPADANNPAATPTDPTDPNVVDPTMPLPVTACAPGVPATSQIQRLSNAQYDRTLYDLLGVASSPSRFLATEQSGVITSLAWSGYQAAADAVAAEVMADPMLRANFTTCSDTACLSDTIVDFGRRAFRRPLDAAEVAGFQDLVDRGAQVTPNGTTDEIAEVLLATFLQSPSFLQLAETSETLDANGNYVLSSHEVATRLSYLLWGSIPDEELDTVADAGQLQTAEQILAQAQRMVVDEKARQMAADFHRTYLHLGANSRWDTATKDTSIFPTFVDGVVLDLVQETEALFDDVFAGGGTFQDLFTTNVAFVTNRTAPLYGLDAAGFTNTPMRTELDAATRPGFLTRAGFLSAYAGQNRTSPILRGAFIVKDVLGIDPGVPDPSASQVPLPTGADLDTNRKQVEAQTGGAPCNVCHTGIVNPPGFVLEAYDGVGTIQTIERATGAPIDTVADVMVQPGVAPIRITTPAELMAAIAAAPGAQRRYAEQWVGFAFGRVLTGPDLCAVDQAATKLTSGGYSIQDLVTDLTQAEFFRTRAVEVTQ